MLVKNAYFELEANPNFLGCHGGLFEDGEYINTSIEGVASRPNHDVVGTVSDGYGRSPVPDFLNAFPYRCVSQRAFDLFKEEKLNLWPEFEWVPVRVLRKSGKLVGHYWWAKFDRSAVDFDVFDYKHSKYTIFPPEAFEVPSDAIVYDKVSKWVLRGEMIDSLDFFHACQVRWYGSLRLKQLVERHQLLGFVFDPIEISTTGGGKPDRIP